MSYVVKNWKDHQHYKNRRPPWIKLHRTLLDDCAYLRLQPASRALAPLMWLLASEGVNGVVEGDAADLAFRLRLTESEVQDGLNGLLSIGYITRYGDASVMLAPCKQEARPETETEGEKETEKKGCSVPKTPTIPTEDEAMAYAIEIDFEGWHSWFDHFQANGWLVGGKSKMKDWKAAMRNGKRRSAEFKANSSRGGKRTNADKLEEWKRQAAEQAKARTQTANMPPEFNLEPEANADDLSMIGCEGVMP